MGYRETNSEYRRANNRYRQQGGQRYGEGRRTGRTSIKRRKKRIRRIKMIGIEMAALVILLGGFLVSRAFKGKEVSAPEKKSPETLEEFAEKKGLTMDAYPAELLELYERNPETKDFVWEYPLKKEEEPEIDLSEYKNSDAMPLFMQWDQRWGYHQYSGNVMGLTGCGPTCLSMVTVYLSGDTSKDPKWMTDFSTENGYAAEGSGTSWTLFSEGGEKLGFDVTEIPLDEKRIAENLKVGNPVVAVMGPGDFTTDGHFIVFVGYEDGKLKVNDPNSRTNSEKMWEFDSISGQIKQLWVFRK